MVIEQDMKNKRFNKIKKVLLGSVGGFGLGVFSPVIVCTAGTYMIGQGYTKIESKRNNGLVQTMFGLPGFGAGVFIQGLLLSSVVGVISLSMLGFIGAVVVGSMVYEIEKSEK